MPTDPTTHRSLRQVWRSGPARAALLNDPARDGLRTLRARRGLVLAYAAIVIGAVAALVLGRFVWLLPVLLLEVVVIGSLNVATRGVVDLRERDLDERQRAVALIAHRRAYKIATASTLAALATSGLWADAVRQIVRPDRLLVALLFLTFSALLMLPTCLVAWTEREG